MKVILLGKVQGTGEAGDIVEVADGYARNFLFPQGLAAQASAGRVKEAEARKKKKEEEVQLALEEAQKHVNDLDGKTIPIRKEAGPEGKLFGSIAAKDITDEIEKAVGIKLPKGVVKLKETIRTVGEYPVHLNFPHGLEADMIVVVEAEETEEKAGDKKKKKKK